MGLGAVQRFIMVLWGVVRLTWSRYNEIDSYIAVVIVGSGI